MFSRYNEKACVFECRLKYAIDKSINNKLTMNGCAPWDYPRPEGKATAISTTGPDLEDLNSELIGN